MNVHRVIKALTVTPQTYEKTSIQFNLLRVQSHGLLTNIDLFTLTTALIACYALIAYSNIGRYNYLYY